MSTSVVPKTRMGGSVARVPRQGSRNTIREWINKEEKERVEEDIRRGGVGAVFFGRKISCYATLLVFLNDVRVGPVPGRRRNRGTSGTVHLFLGGSLVKRSDCFVTNRTVTSGLILFCLRLAQEVGAPTTR